MSLGVNDMKVVGYNLQGYVGLKVVGYKVT